MAERLTRKSLLARGAVVAGAAVIPAACGSTKESSNEPAPSATAAVLTAYRLDPVDRRCKGRRKARGHCGCSACVAHAKNKLFPTPEAADHNRAHRGCNCRIVGLRMPGTQYVALFGNPHNLKTHSVDRRSHKTAAILRR